MSDIIKNTNVLIKINDLSIKYGQNRIISNVSFEILPKQILAVSGPNGAGKSTMLKAMVGLVRPLNVNSINYCGARLHDISYLSQINAIDYMFPLKVIDVVAMGMCSKVGFFNPISQTQIFQVLKIVGIGSHAQESICNLSGGQIQRMLFARMLLQDCKVLILDEPFAAVDAQTTIDLMKIITNLRDSGKSIIIVVHDDNIIKNIVIELC